MAEEAGREDDSEEAQLVAPDLMKPSLSSSMMKAVGLACACSAAAAVDRDPNHILAAAVDDSSAQAEEGAYHHKQFRKEEEEEEEVAAGGKDVPEEAEDREHDEAIATGTHQDDPREILLVEGHQAPTALAFPAAALRAASSRHPRQPPAVRPPSSYCYQQY